MSAKSYFKHLKWFIIYVIYACVWSDMSMSMHVATYACTCKDAQNVHVHVHVCAQIYVHVHEATKSMVIHGELWFSIRINKQSDIKD